MVVILCREDRLGRALLHRKSPSDCLVLALRWAVRAGAEKRSDSKNTACFLGSFSMYFFLRLSRHFAKFFSVSSLWNFCKFVIPANVYRKFLHWRSSGSLANVNTFSQLSKISQLLGAGLPHDCTVANTDPETHRKVARNTRKVVHFFLREVSILTQRRL